MKKQTKNQPDEFKVSKGNIEVLKTIPEMMLDNYWRGRLRGIVMDYAINKYQKEKGVFK